MILELLKNYKEVTIRLIESIKNDEENNLMDEREEILKTIEALGCSKEEIRSAYECLGIENVDRELEKTIKNEMFEVKKELKEIMVRKNASRGYNNSMNKVNVFSAKI
ncbi:MAG: hypothetical protein ACRC7N_18455 [Clostridium sp.]